MKTWSYHLRSQSALLAGILIFALLAGAAIWILARGVGKGDAWSSQLRDIDRFHAEIVRMPLTAPPDLPDGDDLGRWFAIVTARLEEYRGLYQGVESSAATHGGFSSAAAIKQQLGEASSLLARTVEASEQSASTTGTAARELYARIRQIHQSLLGAAESQRDRVHRLLADDLKRQRFGIWALQGLAVVIGLGIGAIAFVAIAVLRQVAARIGDVRRTTESLADGDYLVRIEVSEADGELDRLTRALGRLVARTLGAIEELKRGAQQIDGTAQNLLQASRDQTAASTEQASSVRETSAMVDELARTSWHIAETTTEVSDRAQQALGSAEKGQSAVGQVQENMQEILRKSQANSERITALGDWSERIGDFIELIDHIAEQTNLLALNASVEAARAGEGGEGFAIVASEIRQLSENVGRSTQQIRQLVADIQSATQLSMQAVDEEVGLVQRGMELTLEASHSLEAIVSTICQTANATRDISVSTQQQKQANEQAAISVRELTEVTEGWAHGARTTTAHATDLARLARRFRQTLQYFRIPVGESSEGPRSPVDGPEESAP